MNKRTRAAFTLNLSDGPHKRGNVTARRTGFADIRIDVIHGRVSAGQDELDHIIDIIIDVILCKYIYYIVYNYHMNPTPSFSRLMLPLPHARVIWYCAWFSLPSAIYAYSRPESAHLAVVPASVWASSLLYWRNPVRNSWRRRLDIAVVFSGLTYQSYYAFRYAPARTTPTNTALIVTAASCYGISQYYLARGRMWPATYTHAAIHIVANLANLVLYDGMNNTTHKQI
jgi:hypothetical protein